jgi:hypothetical protein
MAEEHLVVQGATCQCNYGSAPDKLKVLSHVKEYANDADGAYKLIASTKDIGATFEKNTFGSCGKQNNRTCSAVVSEWKNVYQNVKLSNGGQILLETSKGTCPVGGADCIKIINHGQTADISQQNVANANTAITNALNPAVDINSLNQPENSAAGIIFE